MIKKTNIIRQFQEHGVKFSIEIFGIISVALMIVFYIGSLEKQLVINQMSIQNSEKLSQNRDETINKIYNNQILIQSDITLLKEDIAILKFIQTQKFDKGHKKSRFKLDSFQTKFRQDKTKTTGWLR